VLDVLVLDVVVEGDLMTEVDVVVDEFHSVLGLERKEGKPQFNRGGVH
jgi:hypothetical protein